MDRIKVFDNGGETADRYTVIFPDGSMYLMSVDANMPKGVCIYAGNKNGLERYSIDDLKVIQVGDLEKGALIQIINLLLTFGSSL